MQTKLKPYLETLLNLRASLAQDINQMEDNSLRDHAKTVSIPTDNEELCSDHADQELTLTLLESDEEILDHVQAALDRLDDESFGECTQCGKSISSERLEAIPYAAKCAQCAGEQEKNARRN
jgi:RNA polymerase-binding protein DksA